MLLQMPLFYSFCGWVTFLMHMCMYTIYIYISHIFMHSSVRGHLGCFHVLDTVNSPAMNIRVHVSFWIMVFSRYMPSSGIAGSYGNSIFNFLRNFHTVLHSGCTNLHSHRKCRWVPFFPHPLQRLLFVNFLMIWTFWPVWGGTSCSVICNSVMISNVEHLPCACWLSVWLLWRNVYLNHLPIFWLGCFIFDIELHELFVNFGD